MLAKLFTYSLLGIKAEPIEVEVDISPGAMPKTILVGLAEAAVRESTHRVERALVNSGYNRPIDRIVINLSPADLPKDAASFDLPIALGLLLISYVAVKRLEDDVPIWRLAFDFKFLSAFMYTGALLAIYLSYYYFFVQLPAK